MKKLDNITPISEETTSAVDNATETMAEEKPYKFRKLGSHDVFLMFRIISAIGINEFTACFGKEGVINTIKGLSTEEKRSDSGAMIAAASVMLEIANVILGNVGKCEKEIYQMLANTSNMTIEEITAEGNAILFMEMLIDFCKKEEFGDFIKVVSKLFK